MEPTITTIEIPSETPVNPAMPAEYRPVSVAFTGDGKEYFGIWIVNILLSIVTLGIYSAWAKVRNMQYFLGHTKIDNHSFRYLAKPIQILKGRLVAVAFIILLSIIGNLYPVAGVVSAVLLLVLFPWMLNQSLRFNMRMTRYRNIRFGFSGSYLKSLWYFIILPILSVFTLYLLMPLALRQLDKYLVENMSFGGKSFEANTSTGAYYGAALTFVGVSLGLGIVLAIFAAIFGYAFKGAGDSSIVSVVITGIGAAVYVMFLVTVNTVYKVIIRNHVLSNTEVVGVAKLSSTVEVVDAVWVNATNVVMVLATLGLAFPWAKVRYAKLMADNTGVAISPSFEQLTDTQSEAGSVFGEELADAYDIDFSIL